MNKSAQAEWNKKNKLNNYKTNIKNKYNIQLAIKQDSACADC